MIDGRHRVPLAQRILRKLQRTVAAFNSRFRNLYLDIGAPDNVILVAGMGRSGTTWVAELINYDERYRLLFEPFVARLVAEAEGFAYIQYLQPDTDEPCLASRAQAIFAGNVRHPWVDRSSDRMCYRHRIIKEIRCNLMLGWLRQVANQPPLVLVIRHPLQIAASWQKLAWTREQLGIDAILAQPALLRDFPIIGEVAQRIDPDDLVENVVLQWCIYQLVPAHQLQPGDAYLLYYERLLTNPATEIAQLFGYLKRPYSQTRLSQVVKKPSWTNWLQRDFGADQPALLNSWRTEFSPEQIRRAQSILSAFGLDHLYDQEGLPTGEMLFKTVESINQETDPYPGLASHVRTEDREK